MPGGMSGLQIREGPIDGLWWVRLPFSSANTFKIIAFEIIRRLVWVP